MSLAIVDYGVGNLNSVRNMLKKIGMRASLSGDPDLLATADILILPGVGAFGAGMQALRERGLVPVLQRAATDGKKLVGICLGMQLLGTWSEEGDCAGLGLIDAYFQRFDTRKMDRPLPIPHMGWNYVQKKKDVPFLSSIEEPSRFYFVHSYFADGVVDNDVLMTAYYGHTFVAAYQRGNVIGFQFHPEKSHKFGIKLFEGLFAAGSSGLAESD